MALTACQNTVNTTENAEKQAKPNLVNDSRFVTDSFLKNRLEWKSVKTATTPSGNMVVEVTALNTRTGFFPELWSWMRHSNPYPIQYKFTWQNANGMTVDSPISNVWQTVRVKPGETVSFRSVAPTKDCKDFVLSVKEEM